MKDYLVLSHEGNVKILDIPNSISKTKIIGVARRVICETNKPVAELNNVEIYKNYEIYEFLQQTFNNDIPEGFLTVAYFEDYK